MSISQTPVSVGRGLSLRPYSPPLPGNAAPRAQIDDSAGPARPQPAQRAAVIEGHPARTAETTCRVRRLPGPALAVLACALLSTTAACADTTKTRTLLPAESSALADLAAVIECRADAEVTKRLSSNAWKIALDSPDEALPAYRGWKVVQQDNSSIRELLLPAEISVFGYSTRRVGITSEAFLALLEDASIDAVASRLELVQQEQPMLAHIRSRPLSLRNAGDGGIELRGLTAVEVTTHKGVAMVGCETRHDTRAEQLRRRGKEPPQQFAPGIDVAQALQKVMSCEATALDNRTAGWALALSEVDPGSRFKGWRSGHDEDDNAWWAPPAPLTINGQPITRILKLGSTLYAEQACEVAARLARTWQLDRHDEDGEEVLYAGFLEPHIAEDGWHEDRTRIVRQWQPGKTLHGCQYVQTLPEYGAAPDDEVDGDDQ